MLAHCASCYIFGKTLLNLMKSIIIYLKIELHKMFSNLVFWLVSQHFNVNFVILFLCIPHRFVNAAETIMHFIYKENEGNIFELTFESLIVKLNMWAERSTKGTCICFQNQFEGHTFPFFIFALFVALSSLSVGMFHNSKILACWIKFLLSLRNCR